MTWPQLNKEASITPMIMIKAESIPSPGSERHERRLAREAPTWIAQNPVMVPNPPSLAKNSKARPQGKSQHPFITR
jgi:hypothetical protein